MIGTTLFVLFGLTCRGAGEPNPDFDTLTQSWVTHLNEGKKAAAQYHWEASLLLGGRLVRGKQPIAAVLQETKLQPHDWQVLGHVVKDAETHISYTRFRTNQGVMLQVTVWKKMLKRHWRVFDLVIPLADGAGNYAIVAQARQRWVKSVNSKDAKQFVTQMFELNGRQLYDFDLNEGHSDLLRFYSYLDDNNYGFRLKTHHIWAVNSAGAVEIGTYSGKNDMSGWYILLWRIENRQAKIALDYSL